MLKRILSVIIGIVTGVSLYVSIGNYLKIAQTVINSTELFVVTMIFAFLQMILLIIVIVITSILSVRPDLVKKAIKELFEMT